MSTPITPREIAQAAHIFPATKRFVLRDEFGLPYDGSRTEHVLAALSRSDRTQLPPQVQTVAYAIHKSLTTARMSPELAQRVHAYSPYRVCALVAQVANANPSAQIGELADFWLNKNAATL